MACEEKDRPLCELCGGTGLMRVRLSSLPRGFVEFASGGLRQEDGSHAICCPRGCKRVGAL